MSQLRYMPSAQADLDEIWDYIAADNSDAADGFIFALQSLCESIAEMPMMGRSRDDLAPKVRSVPHGRYLIFYRPTTGGVEVIRVLSAARDIENVME